MRLTHTHLATAEGLELIVKTLRDELERKGAMATGGTSKSIRALITMRRAASISGEIRALETWVFTEHGRGAGKRPPVEPIRRWLEAKGIASGKEAERAAWAISTNIAKFGTNKPSSKFAKDGVQRSRASFVSIVAGGVAKDASATLVNSFKLPL